MTYYVNVYDEKRVTAAADYAYRELFSFIRGGDELSVTIFPSSSDLTDLTNAEAELAIARALNRMAIQVTERMAGLLTKANEDEDEFEIDLSADDAETGLVVNLNGDALN